MGDYFQTLAFDSIEEEAGAGTARAAVSWMVSNGYVCESLSECVYGSKDGLGHEPGPNWRGIIDLAEWQRRSDRAKKRPVPPQIRHNFRESALDDFLAFKINGLEAHGRRGVETAMQFTNPEARPVCPTCGNRTSKPIDEVSEFAARWHQRERIELKCPACLVRSRIEDWDWQPDWAFAQASMTFWNWPPISDDAIKRLSAALGGVRIRRLKGKL
jgi:hypothetical protein